MNTRQAGDLGEDAAARFLQKQGYVILERNYRNPLGEIDIIAQDHDVICFVEVKMRKGNAQEFALEAVTRSKQRKISQVALSYLKNVNKLDSHARFDVVTVTKDAQGSMDFDLIQDAFDLAQPYLY